jgi:hypothetical protein
MSARPGRALGGAALALAALTGSALLAGCGGDGPALADQPARASVPSPVPPRPSNGPSAGPSATSAPTASPTVTASPSLPPGDPGAGAPSVPEPSPGGREQELPARTTVGVDAMLGPADAHDMLGGSWTTTDAAQDPCTLPGAVVARRSVGLTDGRTELAETVTTHRDEKAADAQVERLLGVLPQCGWALGEDPRIGSSSLTAGQGEQRLTVVAAEGVTVVLTGSGPGTGPFTWQGLVDIALGTSCPAAPDGCH